MSNIHPNARPFAWAGESETAFLLVHGFTGSPADMRPLGEYLKCKKYGVSGVLLPGHGTSPEEMSLTRWEDWYEAVVAEYSRLTKSYTRVIPAGLSMGGLLCLHLASEEKVPAVVSLSVPVYLGDERIYQAPQMEADYVDKEITPEEQAEKLAGGRFSYEKVPVKCLVSLLELIEIVKNELPAIKAPALLAHSGDDPTAKPESVEYLYSHLGSSRKKLIRLAESGHVITLGKERLQLFKEIASFVERGEGSGCE